MWMVGGLSFLILPFLTALTIFSFVASLCSVTLLTLFFLPHIHHWSLVQKPPHQTQSIQHLLGFITNFCQNSSTYIDLTLKFRFLLRAMFCKMSCLTTKITAFSSHLLLFAKLLPLLKSSFLPIIFYCLSIFVM
jgi:predicted Abi (CAAX) family protease